MTLQELVDVLLVLLLGNEQLVVVVQGDGVFFGNAGAVYIENNQVIIDSVV